MAQRLVDVQPDVTLPKLALELRQPADIRGTILDKNDVAVGGVRVSLYALREDLKRERGFGGQAPNQETTSLEDGSYRFRNVEPGVEYALCVGSCYYHRKFDSVDPRYPTEGGWPRVRASANTQHTRADLRVAIATNLSIAGRVLGEGGAPAAGIVLWVDQGRSISEEDGSFRIEGLSEGRHILNVTPRAGARWQAEVEAGDESLVVDLSSEEFSQ